jgi:hypothetical protein
MLAAYMDEPLKKALEAQAEKEGLSASILVSREMAKYLRSKM